MKKTIIITGAAGNLGKTITANLLEEGYHIHATIGPNDSPEFLIDKELRSKKVNLLSTSDTNDFIAEITSKRDENVVAVICLVGGFTQGGISSTSWETIQKMINLNFATAYNVVQPLISFCKEKKKSLQVIFIGSKPALNPIEGKELLAYALSKSLLFKLADFINVDTNSQKILTSVIVPSTMDTLSTRESMPDVNPNLWVPTENIASTIAFILSDSGKMMRNPIYKIYNQS